MVIHMFLSYLIVQKYCCMTPLNGFSGFSYFPYFLEVTRHGARRLTSVPLLHVCAQGASGSRARRGTAERDEEPRAQSPQGPLAWNGCGHGENTAVLEKKSSNQLISPFPLLHTDGSRLRFHIPLQIMPFCYFLCNS